MALYVIAKLNNRGEHIGYRILDDVSQKIKDTNTSSVSACLRNNIDICNITLDENSIKGTQGSLDRYGVYELVNGNIENQPLVILGKLNGGYKVADINGHIKNVRESDLVTYAKRFGVANGKVVDKDGTEFISAIHGEYNTAEFVRKIVDERNRNKRFVVLGIVHGANDITKTTSAMYFDMHTMKKMSMQIMNRYRESLEEYDENEETNCELYQTKDRGLQEIHNDVYEVDSRCIMRNRSANKDYSWFEHEVVICRLSANNGVYKYLLGDRLNTKTREIDLLAMLKEIKTGNNKIVVTIRTDGDRLIIKSATDEYVYELATIEEQVKNYKVNVDNTLLKLEVLGIEGMDIDVAGRLLKLEFDEVDRTRMITIPSCVVELSKHCLGYRRNSGNIQGLTFKENIKTVDRAFVGGVLNIDTVKSDSLEVCRAFSSKNSDVTIQNMYCPKDIDEDTLAKLYQKVAKKIYVGDSMLVDDERALKVVKHMFKKSNINDIINGRYEARSRYYLNGVKPEDTIVDLDDFQINNSGGGISYRKIGPHCKVSLEYRNGANKKNTAAMVRLILAEKNFRHLTENIKIIEKVDAMTEKVNESYLNRDKNAMKNYMLEKKDEIVLECGVKQYDEEKRYLLWYRFTYRLCIDSFGNRFLARTNSEYINALHQMTSFKKWMRYADIIITGDKISELMYNA